MTGATGGPGPQGSPGAAGSPGTGATVANLASGDSNCPNGGASITDGKGSTSYVCNGASGTGSFSGVDCTTDGGAVGSTSLGTTNGNDTVNIICTANPNDPTCTHSDGFGDTYTYCDWVPGTLGDSATYTQTMADMASAAFVHANESDSLLGGSPVGDSCGYLAATASTNLGTSNAEELAWIYSSPHALDFSGTLYIEPLSTFESNNNQLPCFSQVPLGTVTWN